MLPIDRKIQEQFNLIISASQHIDISEVNTDRVFESWAKNKENLVSFLPFFERDKLIYEYPEKVKFTLSKESKDRKIKDLIKDLWKYPALKTFLSANQESFYTNRVVEEYQAPYGFIKVGQKLVKSLKNFFNSSSQEQEQLKFYRDIISSIINENTVEGYYCISIHPLDYLSISDNDEKWGTCHSLDSDYRSGNLSYMADKSTVVIYIREKNKRHIISNFPPEVEWNSKKWRSLLFFSSDKNMVFASRGYPIELPEAFDLFQKAAELAFEEAGLVYKYTKWYTYQIRNLKEEGFNYKYYNGLIPVGNRAMPLHELFRYPVNSLQYNDLILNCDCNKNARYSYLVYPSKCNLEGIQEEGYAANISNFSKDKTGYFEVGETVECCSCGTNYIDNPSSMFCDECTISKIDWEYIDQDYYYKCDECNAIYPYYALSSAPNGELICPDCLLRSEENGSTRHGFKRKTNTNNY